MEFKCWMNFRYNRTDNCGGTILPLRRYDLVNSTHNYCTTLSMLYSSYGDAVRIALLPAVYICLLAIFLSILCQLILFCGMYLAAVRFYLRYVFCVLFLAAVCFFAVYVFLCGILRAAVCFFRGTFVYGFSRGIQSLYSCMLARERQHRDHQYCFHGWYGLCSKCRTVILGRFQNAAALH